jgi:large subunit ribosomal protein L7/L12
VSKDVNSLVEELSGLTVLEMAKLKEMLEEKWGVKAASGMPMMAMAAAPVAAATAAVESTDFLVELTEVPADKKLSVIKVLREVAGLPLKEAKDMAEAAPKAIKETAPKAEAEDIKKKIEAAGGKVTLKGL